MNKYTNPQNKRRVFYSRKELYSQHGKLSNKYYPMTSWDEIIQTFKNTGACLIVCGYLDDYNTVGHAVSVNVALSVIFEGSNARQRVNGGIAFEFSLASAKFLLSIPQKVYPYYPLY